MINVIVNGAKGRMGEESVKAIEADEHVGVSEALDKGDDLKQSIQATGADVVLDFTHPDVVRHSIETCLEEKVCAVIGTTGLTDADLTRYDTEARDRGVGILVCPNFAIGAVLMMQFAAKAAHYLPSVEIIEYHHDQKADAPSGTAIKTADLIATAVSDLNTQARPAETESIDGARGGEYRGIPIHSVRLPGYVAHQEVIFGGLSQTLSIRHDTIHRDSFMPGVIMAIRHVQSVKGLVYGLENIL